MLRSDLCDYSDAYIVVKGRVNVTGNNAEIKINKKLSFKNNAPFGSYISKINVYANIVSMYNFLEYNNNYSMTSGNLWNYYSDEVNDSAYENNDANNFRINNNEITTSKPFEYKTKLIGSTLNNDSRLDVEVVVPLNI